MKAVGARLPRYDGVGHVTGRTQYVDDVRVGRTLWVKALRSPHHHAAITKLDTARAEAMKGVYGIVTAADVPKNVYGHLEGLGVPGAERTDPKLIAHGSRGLWPSPATDLSSSSRAGESEGGGASPGARSANVKPMTYRDSMRAARIAVRRATTEPDRHITLRGLVTRELLAELEDHLGRPVRAP